MKRIKVLAVAMATLFSTVLLADPVKVRIHGTLKNLNGQEVRLLDRTGTLLSSTKGNGDTYTINTSLEVADGRYLAIYVPSVGTWGDKMNNPTILFMIDGAEVQVNGEIKSDTFDNAAVVRQYIAKPEVIGSKMYAEIQRLRTADPFSPAIKTESEKEGKYFNLYNFQEGGKTEANEKQWKDAARKVQELVAKRTEYRVEQIAQHSRDYAYAGMMNEQFREAPMEEQLKIYAKFDPSIQGRGALLEMKNRIDQLKSSEVGSKAPDFMLPDLTGQILKLSALKGKYVLVDFWASWCGPCIQEIPHITGIWEEYKESGRLEVLGVSVDKDQAKWRSKVAELGLDSKYRQLIDHEHVMGKLYNFQFIPFLVLIGPDGTILERDLRGDRLTEAVHKHLAQ